MSSKESSKERKVSGTRGVLRVFASKIAFSISLKDGQVLNRQTKGKNTL